MTRPRSRRSASRTLLACIAGLVVASIAYRILFLKHLEHTSLVFIGIPALLALALTAVHPTSSVGTVNKTIAIALCLSGIVFGEGFICILLAAPLFFLVGTLGAYAFKKRVADAEGRSSRRILGFVLLAPLCLEGFAPPVEWPREEVVTVSRVIPANADAVVAALASPMQFDEPLPAFFRLGFPTPGKATGAGLQLGDRRAVEFLHGGHHPGVLTLEISQRGPNEVTFLAVSDDSYITHWLSWRSANVQWREVAPGQTRVTWTLRYRRRLDPAFYFTPLERYGVAVAGRYLVETLATPRLITH